MLHMRVLKCCVMLYIIAIVCKNFTNVHCFEATVMLQKKRFRFKPCLEEYVVHIGLFY